MTAAAVVATICAWCPDFNPRDPRNKNASHGMCAACVERLEALDLNPKGPTTMPTTTTTDERAAYLLRHNDPDRWARFRAACEERGVDMRTVLLMLADAFVEGRVALNVGRVRKSSR